jgi:hypothetical protein
MLDHAEAIMHAERHIRHPEELSSFCSNLIPAVKRRVEFGCLDCIATSAILSDIIQAAALLPIEGVHETRKKMANPLHRYSLRLNAGLAGSSPQNVMSLQLSADIMAVLLQLDSERKNVLSGGRHRRCSRMSSALVSHAPHRPLDLNGGNRENCLRRKTGNSLLGSSQFPPLPS